MYGCSRSESLVSINFNVMLKYTGTLLFFGVYFFEATPVPTYRWLPYRIINCSVATVKCQCYYETSWLLVWF